MAHGIGCHTLQHQEERISCCLVLYAAIATRMLAFSIGRLAILPRLVLTVATCRIASKAIISTWLPRQQEYEADAAAANISTAAGCSPDSILTSMRRAYYAADVNRAAALRTCNQRMKPSLAQLQWHLRDSKIPAEPFDDSAGLQGVVDAAAQERGSYAFKYGSKRVRKGVDAEMRELEDCLAAKLYAFRSPLAWADPDPHWLDRIAHMEKGLSRAGQSGTAAGSGRMLGGTLCSYKCISVHLVPLTAV